MADQQWVDPSGPQEPTKQKRKSAKGRKLVRWNPSIDQLVLLMVDYVCAKQGISLPYDEIAREVAEHLTGEGLKQHLAKVIKARSDAGQKVPPKLPKSARRTTLKEPIQDDGDTTDSQPASSLIWEAPEKKKKRSGKANTNSIVDTSINDNFLYGLDDTIAQPVNPVPAVYPTSSSDPVPNKKRKAIKVENSDDEYTPYSPPTKKVMTNDFMPSQAAAGYHAQMSPYQPSNEPQTPVQHAAEMSSSVNNDDPVAKFNAMEGETAAAVRKKWRYAPNFAANLEEDPYMSPVMGRGYDQKPRITPPRLRGHQSPNESEAELQQKRINLLKNAPLKTIAQWSPDMYQEALKMRGQEAHGDGAVHSVTTYNSPTTPQSLPAGAHYGPPEFVNMSDLHNHGGVGGPFTVPRYIPKAPSAMVNTQLFNGLPVVDNSNFGLNTTLGSSFVRGINGQFGNWLDGDEEIFATTPKASTTTTNTASNTPGHHDDQAGFAFGNFFDAQTQDGHTQDSDETTVANQDYNDASALGLNYENYGGGMKFEDPWNFDA